MGELAGSGGEIHGRTMLREVEGEVVGEEDLEEVCQGGRVVESTRRLLHDNKRNVSSRSWLKRQEGEAELAANLLSQCERDECIVSSEEDL
jgi:hypothetical protein